MENKKKLPVSLQFSIVSLGIITTILAVYTIIQLISFSIFSIEYQNELIDKTYNQINLIIENQNIKENNIEIVLNRVSEVSDENLRIYRENDIIFQSDTDKWRKVGLNENEGKRNTLKFIKFRPYLILDKPLNKSGYKIQILQEIDILTDIAEKYVFLFIGAIILGMILSIIGAIYLSRKFLNRLRVLTNSMEDVKQNNIKTRVPLSYTNDEFDKINMLFNSMMDDIEESFDKQSQFVSDASHELRTPLTVLQGHLKLLNRWGKNDKDVLDNSINVCLEEVNRMIKMVNELLELSRSDKEALNLINLQYIYPKEIILDTIKNYELINEKIVFTKEINEDINLKIKEEHLKQLLMIIIDNAIKYNDKEKININIKLDLDEKGKYLSIKDNGIGIDKTHIPKLTDRFYKVDESRQKNNSFGLGLSIANKILSLYNYNLNIASKANHYTKITIEFNE